MSTSNANFISDSEKGAYHAPFYRVAELEDAPAILDIYNDAIATRRSCGHTSEISLVTVIDWLESSHDKRPIWVIEYAQKIIGWFAVEDFYGLPAFNNAVEVSVYISPFFHRQGIATKALGFVEAFLECVGVTHLVACIYAHNAESLNLFSKYGYAQWGCLPKIALIDSTQYDLFILGKRI
jgi:L-amino acid N-acyltransferase YncA